MSSTARSSLKRIHIRQCLSSLWCNGVPPQRAMVSWWPSKCKSLVSHWCCAAWSSRNVAGFELFDWSPSFLEEFRTIYCFVHWSLTGNDSIWHLYLIGTTPLAAVDYGQRCQRCVSNRQNSCTLMALYQIRCRRFQPKMKDRDSVYPVILKLCDRCSLSVIAVQGKRLLDEPRITREEASDVAHNQQIWVPFRTSAAFVVIVTLISEPNCKFSYALSGCLWFTWDFQISYEKKRVLVLTVAS